MTESVPETEPVNVDEEARDQPAESVENVEPVETVDVKSEEPAADETKPLEVEDEKEEESMQVTIMTQETEDDNVERNLVEEKEEQSENDVENDEEIENDDKWQYKRINTLHAELYVPLSAMSGDVIDIEHDGTKQIKVPKGQQGQNITVRMVKNQGEEPNTGAFCGCF